VTGLAIMSDGRHALSGSDDGTLRVWLLAEGLEEARFDITEGVVTTLALLSDHRAVSGSDDGTVTLWDLAAGTALATFTRSASASADH
jgi:WD40 repeat protein